MRAVARRGATAVGRALSRAGLRTGSMGRLLAEHSSWAAGITIGAGALTLVLWNHPTVDGVVLVLGLVLFALALAAVLAATAEPAPAGVEPGQANP
ncbi:hypothetical protein AB0H92_39305 [Streptomyces phaeochromogenes]|uniref:hypothetical protein n=1 Tax=Streptomyces phaeochromogenes TaxID=1923 RepID=UPI00340D56E1